jgi:hypothetical protein
MMAGYTLEDFSEYLDREAIRDVLFRYAHAIDRCDAELLRTVYWPEGIDDHGIFVGVRDKFISWVIPIMREQLSVTQHFLGNMLIRIDGAAANVETYFQAYHRWENPGGAPPEDVIHGGRYLDRMERRDREWRISHRVVSFDYLREYPDSQDWETARHLRSPPLRGLRAPLDPASRLFGKSLNRAPFKVFLDETRVP